MSEEKKNLSIKWLPLPLTVEQKIEIASKMSNLRVEISLLEEKKKSVAASYKSQIDSKESEMLDLSRLFQSGVKEQEVECETKWNFPKDGIVSYYNADGEEIYSRKMTDTEIEAQAEPSMFDDQQTESKEQSNDEDLFDDSYEVVDEKQEEQTGEMTIDEESEVPGAVETTDDEFFEEAEEQFEAEAKDQ